MPTDPSTEIYEAMDRAGLVTGHILSRRVSMEKIISEIRAKLVVEIKGIIERKTDGNN